MTENEAADRKRQLRLGPPFCQWGLDSSALGLRWLTVWFFVLLKADTHGRHPSTLCHCHSNEQRHTHAGAGRGVRLRVSGREGLHQLLLLFRRLPLRSLAARQVAHPHRQDRLIRSHLLPHRLRSLQPGLLGLLSLSLGPAVYPASSSHTLHYILTLRSAPARDISEGRGPAETSRDSIQSFLWFTFNSRILTFKLFYLITLITDIANVVALHFTGMKRFVDVSCKHWLCEKLRFFVFIISFWDVSNGISH